MLPQVLWGSSEESVSRAGSPRCLAHRKCLVTGGCSGYHGPGAEVGERAGTGAPDPRLGSCVMTWSVAWRRETGEGSGFLPFHLCWRRQGLGLALTGKAPGKEIPA